MPRQLKDRIEWIDSAKGMGIVFVVLGHVMRGLVSANLISADTPQFQWFDFTLYTFHMPLFFFLSGLTVEASLRKGLQQFLVARFWTILYPYLLWSLIIGILLIPFGSGDVTAIDILFIPIYPISIFWFLYVLLMCHVIFALVPKQYRLILLLVSAALLFIIEFVPQNTRQLWPPLFHLARFLPFYLAGYFLSDWALKSRVGAATPFILALLLAGATIGAHALIGWKYWSIIALPAGLFGVGLMIATAKLANRRVARVLGLLGESSMAIYVMHTVINALVRKLLSAVHIDIVAVHVVAGATAAIVLPLICHLVLKRFDVLHVLGLGAPPKSNAPRVLGQPARGGDA